MKSAFVGLIMTSMSSIQASHFDDMYEIENFKWDRVAFKTKKDCALDNYPAVSINFINCNFKRVNIYR